MPYAHIPKKSAPIESSSTLTPDEEKELSKLSGMSDLHPDEEKELAYLDSLGKDVVNEMPPSMQGLKGLAVRTGYKALGDNLEGSKEFFKKYYPDLKFSEEIDPKTRESTGEILIEESGKRYRLDPKGLDIRDITDLAYDIPAGIAQGAATAAAGVAGAMGSPYALGAGAIPASMATSAATGAGLEGLRQGLGSLVGVRDPGKSFSPKDIATSFGVSAVTPLLLGSGITKNLAKTAAEKSLAPFLGSALSPEAVETLANQTMRKGRGLVGRGWDIGTDKIAPTFASIFAGYPKEVLNKAYELLPKIKANQLDPNIAKQEIENGLDTFTTAFTQLRTNQGETLGKLLEQADSTGVRIQLPRLLKPLADLRNSISHSQHQTEYKQQLLSDIDDIAKTYFFEKAPGQTGRVQYGIRNDIGYKDTKELGDALSDLAKTWGLNFRNLGTTKSISQATTSADRKVLNTLLKTTKEIRSSLNSNLDNIDPNLAKEIRLQNQGYSTIKELEDEFFSVTKSEEAFSRFLKRKGSLDRAAKAEMSKIAGRDIEDLGAEMAAYEIFSNPTWSAPNFGGQSAQRLSQLKSLGAMAGAGIAKGIGAEPTLGGALGYLGAGTLGGIGLSPMAIRAGMTANKALRPPFQIPIMEKIMPKGFKTIGRDLPQYTPYMLMNTINQER